ncbi:hypothetical protein DFJ73DRAFT_839132 [Zopfochytrium polystomum]|nr:hypothetical protein DFJ73DRAFT_839132 [Zopfochytrium polystomum]
MAKCAGAWMNVKWLKLLAKNGLSEEQKAQPKKIAETQNRARQMRYQKNMNIAAEAIQVVFSSTEESQKAFEHKEEVLKLLRCIYSATVDVPTILDAKNYTNPGQSNTSWKNFWDGPSLDFPVPGDFTLSRIKENGSPWLLAKFNRLKETLLITVNWYSNELRTFTKREMSLLASDILKSKYASTSEKEKSSSKGHEAAKDKRSEKVGSDPPKGEDATFDVKEKSANLLRCGSYPTPLYLVAVTVTATPSKGELPTEEILMLLDAFNLKLVQHFFSPKSVENVNGVVYVQIDDGWVKMDASLKAVSCPPRLPGSSHIVDSHLIDGGRCALPAPRSPASDSFAIEIADVNSNTSSREEPSSVPSTSANARDSNDTQTEQEGLLVYYCKSPAHPSTDAQFDTAKGRLQHIKFHVQRGETYQLSETFTYENGDESPTTAPEDERSSTESPQRQIQTSEIAASTIADENGSETSWRIGGEDCFVKRFKSGNRIRITYQNRLSYVTNKLDPHTSVVRWNILKFKFTHRGDNETTWPVDGMIGAQTKIFGDKLFFSLIPSRKTSDTSGRGEQDSGTSETTETQGTSEAEEREAQVWAVGVNGSLETSAPQMVAQASFWNILGETLWTLSSSGILGKLDLKKAVDWTSRPEPVPVFAIPPSLVPYPLDRLDETPGLSAQKLDSCVQLSWMVGDLQVQIRIGAPGRCDVVTSVSN